MRHETTEGYPYKQIFQSTHPRGVRRRCPTVSITGSDFNPRTHVGCDRSCRSRPTSGSHFNPRTHVGCDRQHQARQGEVKISIHAPTWGATSFIKEDVALGSISIHAPTWGATLEDWQKRYGFTFQSTHPRGVRPHEQGTWQVFCYFNPRTHVGCDILRPILARSTPISIHAPTWGATKICSTFALSTKFQSTHPRGVRRCACAWVKYPVAFQSTHPRGVRHPFVGVIRLLGLISIHAPTWGATQEVLLCLIDRGISIHAPTWGATCGGSAVPVRGVFQSTHPRGVRLLSHQMVGF